MKEREEMYRRNEELTESETKLNQTLEQLQVQSGPLNITISSKSK